MKTLLILLLSSSPALAVPMVCSPMDDKTVLGLLEKNANETLSFVGIEGGSNFPVEITVSKEGTWTAIFLTPKGTCIFAMGVGWQAVEQKPKGVED